MRFPMVARWHGEPRALRPASAKPAGQDTPLEILRV
jgi:hypothetical protein